MTPRKQLQRFYESLKTRAPKNFNKYGSLRGPDLIQLDDDYLKSKRRLAIIGQQVGDWYYNYPEFVKNTAVSKAMSQYQKFDFADSSSEPGYRGTPFWQFFHTVRKSQFPSEPQATRKVLW